MTAAAPAAGPVARHRQRATLAALEASIEMRLFERVRQRMHRTPEATLLYEEIRRLNVGLETWAARSARYAARPSAPARRLHPCLQRRHRQRHHRALSRPLSRYAAIPADPRFQYLARHGRVGRNWTWPPWPTIGAGRAARPRQPVSRRWRCSQGPYADPAGTGRIRAAGRCRCDRVERGGRVPQAAGCLVAAVRAGAAHISIETPYSSTVCQLALAGHGVGIANPATAVGMEAAGLAFRPLAAPVHFECHMILHGSRHCRKPASSGRPACAPRWRP